MKKRYIIPKCMDVIIDSSNHILAESNPDSLGYGTTGTLGNVDSEENDAKSDSWSFGW